jgi:hypothetical protein
MAASVNRELRSEAGNKEAQRNAVEHGEPFLKYCEKAPERSKENTLF